MEVLQKLHFRPLRSLGSRCGLSPIQSLGSFTLYVALHFCLSSSLSFFLVHVYVKEFPSVRGQAWAGSAPGIYYIGVHSFLL